MSLRDRGGLNRLCALLADDEADSREVLALLLRWCGYDVKLAVDGEEALERAKQHRPELIFLDIGMPRRDGYEVCRRLRQSPEFAHARIVAVSGYSGEMHVRGNLMPMEPPECNASPAPARVLIRWRPSHPVRRTSS